MSASLTSVTFDFQEYLKIRRALLEESLSGYLSGNDPARLWEAMRYSVCGGGKRLRAMLCLAAAEAVLGQDNDGLPAECGQSALELAMPCACAIEMVHAMSLIHDDLPVMDNDDYRRGRLTNHKVFGEAMALLAGDALLVLPFAVLARHTQGVAPDVLLDVVAGLAESLGACGLVGGQVKDIQATGQSTDGRDGPVVLVADAAGLDAIHAWKTGALLRFSVWSGARLAGAGPRLLETLSRFAEVLGLAFQVRDDLLDVTSTREALGKTPGKDAASRKATWVSLFGIEKSKEKLAELANQGQELLGATGLSQSLANPLSSMLEYAIQRNN